MNGKIAIISTNRAKYSETFIQTQVTHLPYPIVLYTDGYFPSQISLDKGKTTKKLKNIWWKSANETAALQRSFKKHNIRLVLVQYGPSGVAVMDVCKSLQIPFIVHFHGYDAYRKDILQSYGQKYPELFKNAAAVIGVSKDMKQQLQDLGCPEEKVHHIPCGIDAKLFSPNEIFNNNSMDFVVCGRFVAKKGPLLTLKAFHTVVKKYPKSRLIFIGDGELRSETELMVTKLALENNVIFKGICTQQEIAETFRNAIALVQHSVTTEEGDSEGTPLSVMEAGAAGLPVVATKHAGIKDVVIDGKTGFLVTEHDTEEMAEKMITLLKNRELAYSFGKEGRHVILKKFTKEIYIRTLAKLIERLVAYN